MSVGKLVVLDRDGVINVDSDAYIKNASEWQAIEGSLEAIAKLKVAGYAVYIATNQSGLARGLFTEADLAGMHDKMESLLSSLGVKIDGLFYCDHLPEAGCDCRKPGVGLLNKIEAHWGQSVKGQPFIGDSMKDLQAGARKGCQPILVRSGKGLQTEQHLQQSPPAELLDRAVPVYDSLSDAVDDLLNQHTLSL